MRAVGRLGPTTRATPILRRIGSAQTQANTGKSGSNSTRTLSLDVGSRRRVLLTLLVHPPVHSYCCHLVSTTIEGYSTRVAACACVL
jgi:hypothetical protein